MDELLCYLRDGACCTLVLVEAGAREVAEALGHAVSTGEGRLGLACGSDVEGRGGSMKASGAAPGGRSITPRP